MSDTDIHSCGYYCDRHACIVAQRNELRDKLFEGQAVKTYSGGKPNYTQPIKQDDIIRMYEKANGWSPEGFDKTVKELERFANLVAAAEREWVGLTDEEMKEIWDERGWYVTLFQKIEAKLKEKNNG